MNDEYKNLSVEDQIARINQVKPTLLDNSFQVALGQLGFWLRTQSLSEQDLVHIIKYYVQLKEEENLFWSLNRFKTHLGDLHFFHPYLRIEKKCTIDQIAAAYAVAGLVSPTKGGHVSRHKKSVSDHKKPRLQKSSYEQRRSGGISFGKYELPFEIFSLILSFYGDGLVELSRLCLVNKSVAHVIGSSAIGILLCAQKVVWNVPQYASSDAVSVFSEFLTRNKGLQSFVVSCPCTHLFTSISSLSKCTNLSVLKLWYSPCSRKMKRIDGIEKLTNLHTLAIMWPEKSNLQKLHLLTRLKHLSICTHSESGGGGKRQKIRIELPLLETLEIETNCEVEHLTTSLTQLKLNSRVHQDLDFIPSLESIDLSGYLNHGAIKKMLEKQTGLKHFGYFHYSKYELEIPSTLISLSISWVPNFCLNQFEHLECAIDLERDFDFDVTKSARFALVACNSPEHISRFEQLVDRFGHLKLFITCPHNFNVRSIVVQKKCKHFEFNGMLLTSDKVIVYEN